MHTVVIVSVLKVERLPTKSLQKSIGRREGPCVWFSGVGSHWNLVEGVTAIRGYFDKTADELEALLPALAALREDLGKH